MKDGCLALALASNLTKFGRKELEKLTRYFRVKKSIVLSYLIVKRDRLRNLYFIIICNERKAFFEMCLSLLVGSFCINRIYDHLLPHNPSRKLFLPLKIRKLHCRYAVIRQEFRVSQIFNIFLTSFLNSLLRTE